MECKIYYKYAKKIYYESKEVKHCHDEPSVECEDLMKMCHEEPEEVCGVKIEKGILLCWQKIYLKLQFFISERLICQTFQSQITRSTTF